MGFIDGKANYFFIDEDELIKYECDIRQATGELNIRFHRPVYPRSKQPSHLSIIFLTHAVN